jgi:hypothetical protein
VIISDLREKKKGKEKLRFFLRITDVSKNMLLSFGKE